MQVKTYRAKTMQQALDLVRRELGPDAAVLQTREIGGRGWTSLLGGGRQIEVTASTDVSVPSRLPKRRIDRAGGATAEPDGPPHPHGPWTARFGQAELTSPLDSAHQPSTSPHQDDRVRAPAADALAGLELDRLERNEFQNEVRDTLSQLYDRLDDLCRRGKSTGHHDLPESLFRLFTDLIEAEVSEELVRELIERVRTTAPAKEIDDATLLRARVLRMIEAEIPVSGPIRAGSGRRRMVALVGPTGVGKTTTIAKLAANYRLKHKLRVGLITVDTYRIAAVEQLRTYADIIELPMEVVSTPREMRQAVDRLAQMDLVLVDTAGRSPRDEVKIKELKAFLAEAAADEVHLVLSSMASAGSLCQTAEQFASAGTTALLFTKLDEVSTLGSLLPVVRASRLPVSYVTTGQNVPEDIEVAQAAGLARGMLGMRD